LSDLSRGFWNFFIFLFADFRINDCHNHDYYSDSTSTEQIHFIYLSFFVIFTLRIILYHTNSDLSIVFWNFFVFFESFLFSLFN
jgi:hypothetical protein